MTTPNSSSSASSTTTLAPRRPSEADLERLGFAQSIELAARDLYALAVEAGAGGQQHPSLAAIAAHHDAYAQAISALIGRSAPQSRDEGLYQSLRSAFSTKSSAMATAAHSLENTLVTTHRALLAELDGTEGAALIASILIVEARHSVALASIAGLTPTRDADAFFVTPPVQPLSPIA